jgi:AraC-like DNA-binding protein
MDEPFKIFKVGVGDAEKIAASLNELHHHDFEELLIGIKGGLEHFIDFTSTTIEAPFISFVTKGKIHRVRPAIKDGQCDIWVIRFQSEFIPETTFQLYACFHDNANIPFPSNRCFQRFITLCEMMYDETQQASPDYAVLRHLLNALLTMFEAERKKRSEDQGLQAMHNDTFTSFLKILEENYRRPVSVSFYAEKLFMSTRNLNIICQNILQQSVSEIIETRKLIEAKNLLSSTNMSISEIGFELCYKEKAYFTNVFKRKAGQTPTAFRKEIRNQLT